MILLRQKVVGLAKLDKIRDYDEIIASGELNVVTDYNSIGYFIVDDTAAGFQFELIAALENDWGVRVNLFLENSFEENLKGLQIKRYDLVARNIPVNMQLREKYAFTAPITLNKQVLVQRKSEFNNGVEPVRQHLDLAQKTIWVTDDSPVILRLNNLSHEIGDSILVKKEQLYEAEQLVMMVAAGDIDFTVCDYRVAKMLADKLIEIDIETDIGFTQFESWALRIESPQLLDSLNSWLERFKSSDSYDKMYRRYQPD